MNYDFILKNKGSDMKNLPCAGGSVVLEFDRFIVLWLAKLPYPYFIIMPNAKLLRRWFLMPTVEITINM